MSKPLSKKKASMLNMALMGAYQIVTALFGFVLPSMILNTYGASLHGYTTTVSNIMSYVALVNAGLAPAAVQALYTPLAKKDTYRLNQVLNAIDHFYTVSGCLYTIAIAIIASVLPFVLSNQLPPILIVLLMIVIGASSTLECFIYSKYKVLLQADQRLFVVSVADTIMYFVRVGLQVILIWAKASIVIVMAIPAVMVIFRMMILSIYCRNNYPGLDKKVVRDNSALSKRWSAMAHQLAGLVVYNTDVTLLTLFGSLVQVSIYSVYNLVFQKLYELLTNIFSSGTLASFGQLMSENKRESLLRNYDLYEYGYYIIITTDIIYYSHKHILNISCKKSVLRVLRVALVIAINVILYKLLVGKYIMNGWGEWIMYAVIASIIVLVTTGLIYFITEKKQFLACMNLIIKRKVKR